MARSKGRVGRPWRRAADAARNSTDICSICGHGGARTVHHDPPLAILEQLELDPRDPQYLRIAHGAPHNPCSQCPKHLRHCNQVAGSKVNYRHPSVTASRNW